MTMGRSSKTQKTIKRKPYIKTLLTTLTVIILSVAFILSVYHEKFIFKCIFKAATGYDCPFCGAQRAINHIMHLEFRSALCANPFIFVISPYALLVILCICNIFPEGSTIRRFAYNKLTIIAVGAATIAWGILRNTDFIKNILTFAVI